MDEGNHIARGAAFLGTGDPRLSLEHPPLVNTLSALPAHLLLDLRLPLDEGPWWKDAEWYHFADNFLWRSNDNFEQIVFLARLPIIALGLLLMALVFRWASELGGRQAGLLALALVALDPNILAHTRLSTTDLGGTLFVFLAAYAMWRYARGERQTTALLAT
ncbi:MAG: phospholipid carrier-dependent glycosyltransferase, partial [Delftia sp.]|nr:phospholipid carrier-dependent glycosyltransferase [Delftia sp.]